MLISGMLVSWFVLGGSVAFGFSSLPSSCYPPLRRKIVSRCAFRMTKDFSRRGMLIRTIGIPTLVSTASSLAVPNQAQAVIPLFEPKDLNGRVILITGGNTGLGLESAKRLSSAGAKVILTARTADKAAAAVAAVRESNGPSCDVSGIVLDLSDLASVNSFTTRLDAVLGKDKSLDVLMNNAGVMAIPERLTTKDGFERQLGINHLGHFALTATVLPFLKRAQGGFRVINVSSAANQFATADSMRAAINTKLDPEYSPWGNYGLSKASNILFTKELQRRFDAEGLRASAVTLHPGGVATDLGRYMVGGVEKVDAGASMKSLYEDMNPLQKGLAKVLSNVVLTVPEGGNTQVFLAAGADSAGDLTQHGGLYYDLMKPSSPSKFTEDPELAKKLWDVSEQLTGAKYEF